MKIIVEVSQYIITCKPKNTAFSAPNNFNIAINFHSIAEGRVKKRIVEAIKEYLRKKFDATHYYHAVLFSVIPLYSEFFALPGDNMPGSSKV